MAPVTKGAPRSGGEGEYGCVSQTDAADYRLGFTSLDREVEVDSLPIEGRLPDWLRGTLYRVGPARFEVGGRRLNHFFDGFSMLHRFSFAAGGVSYANRFLQSRAFRAAQEGGRLDYQEFGTNPERSLVRRVGDAFKPRLSDNAAVGVVRLGTDLVAMTASPRPIAFDADTLAVSGVARPSPAEINTAFPHLDRTSGEVLFWSIKLGPRPTYRLYARRGTSRWREIARLPAPHPTYLSSFAITERYAVFAECPFLLSPFEMIFSDRPYLENFRWSGERPTVFTVVDRHSGLQRARLQAEPFFYFHHVNAFERDGDIVLDLVAYPDSAILERFYLAGLGPDTCFPDPELRRYRLPLDGEVASGEAVAAGFENPHINYVARNGRPYRHAYGCGYGATGFLARIQKVDLDTGATTEWAEPGVFPDEALFLAAPDARAEDDGVVLSIALEPAAGTSFLIVLDAHDLGELARVALPHHLPFALGGSLYEPPGAA
jgi:beta,beta-carotene 9',10'-dioxygenase